jgi:riboflavin biosynthesis pyrimidine reductase
MATSGFLDYCRQKEEAALAAPLAGFATLSDEAVGADLLSIGNPWTRRLFDGDFHRSPGSVAPDLPAVSLLLSQLPAPPEASAGQAVGASAGRGLGDTVRHLVHEGLSRVDADAVMGGMGADHTIDHVCSVWHPELVRLREEWGLPRHPVQVLVTNSCDVPFERCLLFQEPSLRVIVVTRSSMVATARARLRQSPWVEVLDAGEPLNLPRALTSLRDEGIAVVSAVGGRRVASTLLQAQVVTDLYVTTCAPDSAAAAVAFYDGPPLLRRRLLSKTGRGSEVKVRFEHLVPSSVYAPGLRLGMAPSSVLR